MRCPKCNSIEDKVIDSRLSKEGTSIRRRRECLGCEARFTTYEEIERVEMRVVKRDGRHEPFDRQKLIASIAKACEKRPVSLDTIEKMTEEIIQALTSGEEREVPSQWVGAMVMERLHAVDPIAYVRYASVYRQFQEIGDFIEEIQALKKRTRRSQAQPEFLLA